MVAEIKVEPKEPHWDLILMPSEKVLMSRLRAVADGRDLVREVYEVFLQPQQVVAGAEHVAFSVVSPLLVLLAVYAGRRPAELTRLQGLVPRFVEALFPDRLSVASAVNAYYANTPASTLQLTHPLSSAR